MDRALNAAGAKNQCKGAWVYEIRLRGPQSVEKPGYSRAIVLAATKLGSG